MKSTTTSFTAASLLLVALPAAADPSFAPGLDLPSTPQRAVLADIPASDESASAEPSDPREAPEAATSGKHAHDGFYLGLRLGPAFSSVGSEGAETVELSGAGTSFDLAIGGAVAANLIVAAEFGATTVSDPTLSVAGEESTADGYSMTSSGFGAGVSYYIMPYNMYVGAAAYLISASVESDDGVALAESDAGFGAALRVGKEFWVSDNWGLGVNLEVQGGSMDDGDSGTLEVSNVKFGVGATYN